MAFISHASDIHGYPGFCISLDGFYAEAICEPASAESESHIQINIISLGGDNTGSTSFWTTPSHIIKLADALESTRDPLDHSAVNINYDWFDDNGSRIHLERSHTRNVAIILIDTPQWLFMSPVTDTELTSLATLLRKTAALEHFTQSDITDFFATKGC